MLSIVLQCKPITQTLHQGPAVTAAGKAHASWENLYICTLHIGYMVVGYKVKYAIWSIFGWSHLLIDIL